MIRLLLSSLMLLTLTACTPAANKQPASAATIFANTSAPASTSAPADTSEHFSLVSESYGATAGVKYFVIIGEQTSLSQDIERLLDATSYMLRYQGLEETYSADDADYYLFVSYASSQTNPDEQFLQLLSTSKRVFEATGEARPSWITYSEHAGTPSQPGNMLAMHVLAMRNLIGQTITPLERQRSISNQDPQLQEIKAAIKPQPVIQLNH